MHITLDLASSFFGCIFMLQVTEISDVDQFFELETEWKQLVDKSKNDNIFLTWEYLSTYYKYFGNGKQLRLLVIKDNGKFVAIAPLRQSHYNLGVFGYTVIEPLGEGADYTGLILTERQPECFWHFINFLTQKNDWDFINLFNIPGTSPIPKFLTPRASRSPKIDVSIGKKCPFISVSGSFQGFMQSLDTNFRKDLRRCQRNLENDYGKIELKKQDAFSTVDDAMDRFVALHQERWCSKVGKGIFETKQILEFHKKIANKFAENGWLALYFLTVKDVPISAQYCLEYKNKIFYALSGFSKEYSKYSPGNILTLKIIEECFKKQVSEFDFMKGEEAYKFNWTKEYRNNLGIRFTNNKLASTFVKEGIDLAKKTRLDRVLSGYIIR
jgi:CelD/BcsL family acetyltransferase involved in cellulose biosynthesis